MRAAAPGLFSTRVSAVAARYIPVRQFSPMPIFLVFLPCKRYVAFHRATFKYTGVVCPDVVRKGKSHEANTDRQTAQGVEAEGATLRNHGRRYARHGNPRDREGCKDVHPHHALSGPPHPYAPIARRVSDRVVAGRPREGAYLEDAREGR